WVEAGRARLEELMPIADRHGLTALQLACEWTLAQEAVTCVAPTLIQEIGESAKAVEEKRAELAALPAENLLTPEEVDEIGRIGDNTGCMALKGGVPDYEGDPVADRWPLDAELAALAERWEIDPERELQVQA
ncbi:MAG: aldo/keto reductase, partial [Solirubrobacterales bacterium]